MIEQLINFLKNQQVNEALAKAFESNQAVEFNSPELKINVTPNNNGFSIQLESRNTAKTESAAFKEFISTISDDIFQNTCEMLGNEKVKQISTCLESDDLEQVRSGIIAFKTALKEYAVSQIGRYKKFLKTL